MKTTHSVPVLLSLTLLASTAGASVKFLAVGTPSAIRIQGEGKAMTMEKTSWKNGKFSGTFHLPLDTLETGISMRDRHMKEKYLETGKFPNADLELVNCLILATETSCPGILTLHGVTRAVSIVLKGVDTGAKTMKVAADFAVKLSEYGISTPKFANITVAEDVKIQVDSETAKP